MSVPIKNTDKFLTYFKQDLPEKCWNWNGTLSLGYGIYYEKKKVYRAHRVSFAIFKGSLVPPLVIDHLCANRRCVNPHHLRQVTQKENVASGDTVIAASMAKTKCINGHPLTGDNLIQWSDGHRRCRTCFNETHKKAGKNAKTKVRIPSVDKKCSKCRIVLPIEIFYNDHRSSDGRRSECWPCQYALQKIARKRRLCKMKLNP